MMWSVMRRVEDLALEQLAGAGLELQVGIHAPALAGRHRLDVAADLIERETGIGIQGQAGQGPRHGVAAEADDGELVVHRLIAGILQRITQVLVDEGRLAGRKGPQRRYQRPPRDLRGIGLAAREQPH